jgi:hypothetical protein
MWERITWTGGRWLPRRLATLKVALLAASGTLIKMRLHFADFQYVSLDARASPISPLLKPPLGQYDKARQSGNPWNKV